mgnify:CR=1 FL=1
MTDASSTPALWGKLSSLSAAVAEETSGASMKKMQLFKMANESVTKSLFLYKRFMFTSVSLPKKEKGQKEKASMGIHRAQIIFK